MSHKKFFLGNSNIKAPSQEKNLRKNCPPSSGIFKYFRILKYHKVQKYFKIPWGGIVKYFLWRHIEKYPKIYHRVVFCVVLLFFCKFDRGLDVDLRLNEGNRNFCKG